MNKYIDMNSPQYFAFNIWSIESAKAVMYALSQKQHDIILQTSVKVFEALDREELRWYVTRYAEKGGIHVFLHLDHARRLETIQEAVRHGWDSVMIDASDKPLEENIYLINEARSCIGKMKRNVLVEAEIGQIYGAEDDIVSEKTGVAEIKEIEEFVRRVDIDMLAVAIGTVHGQCRGVPRLHYDLIEKTSKITNLPLVIHGGSGLTEGMLLQLLSFKNVKKINISTDVKLAYRAGIEKSRRLGYMEENGFDPLRVMDQIRKAIEYMVMEKLSLLEK